MAVGRSGTDEKLEKWEKYETIRAGKRQKQFPEYDKNAYGLQPKADIGMYRSNLFIFND
jgi:hypothetical protein